VLCWTDLDTNVIVITIIIIIIIIIPQKPNDNFPLIHYIKLSELEDIVVILQ
jgi:hypothetical protein